MNEVLGPAVHEARNAWPVGRPWLAWLAATGALCLLLVLLGAVDSYGLPLVVRLAFWGGLFAVALLLAIGIEAALLRAGVSPLPLWRWISLFALILASAMAPVAYVANSLSGWAPLSMMAVHFANSLVISAAFVSLRIGIVRVLSDSGSTQPTPPAPIALMARLSPGLREAQLYALEAEGHYVRVHTNLGSEMVLMRLKDAISEAANTEGFQVHRSWWVARAAVKGSNARTGSLELLLRGETRVPVSRNRVKALRETGWI